MKTLTFVAVLLFASTRLTISVLAVVAAFVVVTFDAARRARKLETQMDSVIGKLDDQAVVIEEIRQLAGGIMDDPADG